MKLILFLLLFPISMVTGASYLNLYWVLTVENAIDEDVKVVGIKDEIFCFDNYMDLGKEHVINPGKSKGFLVRKQMQSCRYGFARYPFWIKSKDGKEKCMGEMFMWYRPSADCGSGPVYHECQCYHMAPAYHSDIKGRSNCATKKFQIITTKFFLNYAVFVTVKVIPNYY